MNKQLKIHHHGYIPEKIFLRAYKLAQHKFLTIKT